MPAVAGTRLLEDELDPEQQLPGAPGPVHLPRDAERQERHSITFFRELGGCNDRMVVYFQTTKK
jgi:hypothetical protein